MIDTDKCEHILYGTKFNPIDVYNVAEELLTEVKRLRALADALFNLIPSHLSTEATDVWNEHMDWRNEE